MCSLWQICSVQCKFFFSEWHATTPVKYFYILKSVGDFNGMYRCGTLAQSAVFNAARLSYFLLIELIYFLRPSSEKSVLIFWKKCKWLPVKRKKIHGCT